MDNQQHLINLLNNYNPENNEEKTFKTQFMEFLEKDGSFDRSNPTRHITASSWIVDFKSENVLLTHHMKLDKLLQLGGHCEGSENVIEAAMREAKEESGLAKIRLYNNDIFDVDIHTIPLYKGIAEHQHYDIRFLFEADSEEPLEKSEESKSLFWMNLEETQKFKLTDSIKRMVEKTRKYL